MPVSQRLRAELLDKGLDPAEPPGREDPTNVDTLVDLLFIAMNEDGEIERLVVG